MKSGTAHNTRALHHSRAPHPCGFAAKARRSVMVQMSQVSCSEFGGGTVLVDGLVETLERSQYRSRAG